MTTDDTSADPFADLVAANDSFAERYQLGALPARAAKGLALLTCMDSRIDPLGMLGLKPGDAKILRNAGARVTDDVLRTLVLATYLLGVDRVMVVAHTKCRMAETSPEAVHQAIADAGGPDTRGLAFLTTGNQEESLCADVDRVRAYPYLRDIAVAGYLLDLSTGRLKHVC